MDDSYRIDNLEREISSLERELRDLRYDLERQIADAVAAVRQDMRSEVSSLQSQLDEVSRLN